MNQSLTTASKQILMIEDDTDAANLMAFVLERNGYSVLIATNGQAGLQMASEHQPDLVLLDRMLPDMDGLEVCRRLRQRSSVPILVLTARTSVADRVDGLDTGANDYLLKPCAHEELLARIRAHLRLGVPTSSEVLQFADVTLSLVTYEVARADRPLSLSPKEFELLQFFLRHPGKVLRRDQLLLSVWGTDEAIDGNVLHVYVGYLRQKLEQDGGVRLIHTRRGIGFILSETAPI